MEVKANVKYVRMSPRKVRLVLDVIRKMPVEQAQAQLNHIGKKAAEPIAKLVNSAIANAENNFNLKKSNLFIKEIKAGEGPKLKRWMPRAFGRATLIRKRTSHIDIVLAEITDSGIKGAKKTKIEAPIKLGAKPKDDEGVKVKEDKKKTPEAEEKEEKGKIEDQRKDGRRGHSPIEGGSHKGFTGKMFRRKSG
jgi:large subunit ribosomal protein L22